MILAVLFSTCCFNNVLWEASACSVCMWYAISAIPRVTYFQVKQCTWSVVCRPKIRRRSRTASPRSLLVSIGSCKNCWVFSEHILVWICYHYYCKLLAGHIFLRFTIIITIAADDIADTDSARADQRSDVSLNLLDKRGGCTIIRIVEEAFLLLRVISLD